MYYCLLRNVKHGDEQVSVPIRKRLHECMAFVVLASGVRRGHLNLSFFDL